MKQTTPYDPRPILLTCVLLLSGLLLLAPLANATTVGSWSYPKSDDERAMRETVLEEKLAGQEEAYQSHYVILTAKKKELADLEGRIAAAKDALDFQKRPLTATLEKYHQAQRLSMLDPMISTEPQRLEVIAAKKETAAVVAEHEAKVQKLEEQVPGVKATIMHAVEQHKSILMEIDTLIKHRDAVRELVFLRNVAD